MIGEILDAKYRIDKQLGAGGMGNVYLATHLGTTRTVAVKVIAPRWAAEPHFLARFRTEAQACGRLRHPNIINVTDFGVAKAAAGDVAYLVMEYLDGQTLARFQETNSRVPLPLIVDLLDQVGLALTEAHRQGIVHRDLKPDNVWLEPNGRGGFTAKVLDFGVAKVNLLDPGLSPPLPALPNAKVQRSKIPDNGDETETLALDVTVTIRQAEETETVAIAPTQSGESGGSFDPGPGAKTVPGSLLGTPAYMSPEQALGRPIDFRSDIYSLAVVAYSMVSGELPFKGKTAQELIDYHGTPENPLPRAGLRETPPDVAAAILAGLARDPADRPQSAVEWSRRFHNAVDAEFLALRRSKSFVMQHLGAFTLLLIPFYTGILSAAALLSPIGKVISSPRLRNVLVPLAAAIIFVFFDNLLRTSAALIAADERVRIRRLLSFRVSWHLLRMLPALCTTQAWALVYPGPGWITGDCLWPVVCVVERLSGRAALLRSRDLMAGLRTAGRALAIRHLALAAFALAEIVRLSLFPDGKVKQVAVFLILATCFPIFVLYAGAPLFLYDRTAASESGPLLQLDRTPDVRTSAHALSFSSLLWLLTLLIYLLYLPVKQLLFGR
jgi:serine/threonine protein kinase